MAKCQLKLLQISTATFSYILNGQSQGKRIS